MKYKIELPKILCLTLVISKFAKNAKYYNTNDLIKIANKMKPELVRLRKDKKDYKYFEDTNFGGLRGNFSTALTLKGFIKKNNSYSRYYGIGKSDRLFNAFTNGDIILDYENYLAYTNKVELKNLLEQENKNYTIRESQAHIKIFLKNHPDFPLIRDINNFPKKCVLKSKNNKYYLRILFNTFISKDVIEFNLLDYLTGTKIKQFNMHALFVIPSDDNAWEKFYVIDSKELLTKNPLFLYYDIKNNKFYDNNKNEYPFMTLEESIEKISGQEGNIEERLKYKWKEIKKNIIDDSITNRKDVKESEYSTFVKNFLNWNTEFKIYDKEVTKVTESSSGGPDVIIEYSGGTTQNLELEHDWKSYISHKHYKSNAWKDSWLYADEEWNFEKIKKIFKPYLDNYSDNIPKVYLCTNKETHAKEAYEVDWDNLSYKKLDIN